MREAEDRRQEFDRQKKREEGMTMREGWEGGVRKKLMEKGKRAEQEKAALKKNEVGKSH